MHLKGEVTNEDIFKFTQLLNTFFEFATRIINNNHDNMN